MPVKKKKKKKINTSSSLSIFYHVYITFRQRSLIQTINKHRFISMTWANRIYSCKDSCHHRFVWMQISVSLACYKGCWCEDHTAGCSASTASAYINVDDGYYSMYRVGTTTCSLSQVANTLHSTHQTCQWCFSGNNLTRWRLTQGSHHLRNSRLGLFEDQSSIFPYQSWSIKSDFADFVWCGEGQ